MAIVTFTHLDTFSQSLAVVTPLTAVREVSDASGLFAGQEIDAEVATSFGLPQFGRWRVDAIEASRFTVSDQPPQRDVAERSMPVWAMRVFRAHDRSIKVSRASGQEFVAVEITDGSRSFSSMLAGVDMGRMHCVIDLCGDDEHPAQSISIADPDALDALASALIAAAFAIRKQEKGA